MRYQNPRQQKHQRIREFPFAAQMFCEYFTYTLPDQKLNQSVGCTVVIVCVKMLAELFGKLIDIGS